MTTQSLIRQYQKTSLIFVISLSFQFSYCQLSQSCTSLTVYEETEVKTANTNASKPEVTHSYNHTNILPTKLLPMIILITTVPTNDCSV